MAKLEFTPVPVQKSEPIIEEVVSQVQHDYSPVFNQEKADQLDTMVKCLKTVMGNQNADPEVTHIDTQIAKYTKILELLRGKK